MTSPKLTAAVEAYLADLRAIRATGGATAELSYHTPTSDSTPPRNGPVGAGLKPALPGHGFRVGSPTAAWSR